LFAPLNDVGASRLASDREEEEEEEEEATTEPTARTTRMSRQTSRRVACEFNERHVTLLINDGFIRCFAYFLLVTYSLGMPSLVACASSLPGFKARSTSFCAFALQKFPANNAPASDD